MPSGSPKTSWGIKIGDRGPWLFVAGVAAALAQPVPAKAQCQYEVSAIIQAPDCPFPLDPPPTLGTGLNIRGDVTGHFNHCDPTGSEYLSRTFLWTEQGGMVILDPPQGPGPASGAGAEDINRWGLIAGRMDFSNGAEWGFIWQDGEWMEIPPLDGGFISAALAVSDAGHVTGYRDDATTRYGFLWLDGEYQIIPPPRPPSREFQQVICRDANANGLVTGYTTFAPTFQPQTFLWQDGRMVLLPLPKGEGWTAAHPWAVNMHGDVVGLTFAYPPDIFIPLKPSIAHLWPHGEPPVSLGTLPGFDGSGAVDIDRFGRIVGTVWNSVTQAEESVIWQDGDILLLDDYVQLGLGVNVIWGVRCVNDRGQLLVRGSIGNGTLTVLLSPITASPADVSGDCEVDGDDLIMLLEEWNKPESFADVDGDGQVNGGDLGALLLDWTGP
jgi:uncharacterized membrane protein